MISKVIVVQDGEWPDLSELLSHLGILVILCGQDSGWVTYGANGLETELKGQDDRKAKAAS